MAYSREINWLRAGKRGDEPRVVRDTESFNVPDGDLPAEEQPLSAVERYHTGELDQDLWKSIAVSLRGVLMDFYAVPFIADATGDGDGAGELSERAGAILSEDGNGLVECITESLIREDERIFPVQAVDLHWGDSKRAMMLLSVGRNERSGRWFLSVAVGSYLEFFNESVFDEEPMEILEKRWRELPGDGSLTRSLEMTLSGDLFGLSELGFEDRIGHPVDSLG